MHMGLSIRLCQQWVYNYTIYNEKYFSDDHFSYSPCHYLEGITDVLPECSGLVQIVGLCAQTWWSWRCIPSAKVQSALHSRAMLSGPPSLRETRDEVACSLSYLF